MIFAREYSKLLLVASFLISGFTLAEPPLEEILRVLRTPTINYSKLNNSIIYGIKYYPENVEFLREMARLLKKESYWDSADQIATDIAHQGKKDPAHYATFLLRAQYRHIFTHLSEKAFKDYETILILTNNKKNLTAKDKDIFKILTANVSKSPQANVVINYLYEQISNVFESDEIEKVKKKLFEIAIKGDVAHHKNIIIDNIGTPDERNIFLSLDRKIIHKAFPQLSNITTDYMPGRLDRISKQISSGLGKGDIISVEFLVMQYAKNILEEKKEITLNEIKNAITMISHADFTKTSESEIFYAFLALNKIPTTEYELFNSAVNIVTEKLASMANKNFIQGNYYLLSDEIFSFLQKTAKEGIFTRNVQLAALYFLKNGSLSIYANKDSYKETLRLFVDNAATEPEVHRFLIERYRGNTAYSQAIEKALPHMNQQNIAKLRNALKFPTDKETLSAEYKRLRLAVSRFTPYRAMCLQYNALIAGTKKLLGRQ